MAERIDKPVNRIIQNMRRKNKKFDRYMKQKEGKRIIRIQPKLPGMKKGKSVTIKPVGMVFKVEKKLAGGLLKTGIKAAVRSQPFKRARKKIIDKINKVYDPEIKKRTGIEKKEIQALKKLDIQRGKSSELFDMTQFVLRKSRKEGKKGATRIMRNSRRALVNYIKNQKEKATAMFDKKFGKGKQRVKLNSKGGIQKVANKLKKASKAHAAQAVTLEKIAKKSKGGMADYYKGLV
tara:strand:- start:59 stop:763 length:705 start_codon:yes stop_codon:yes gene_type:complete